MKTLFACLLVLVLVRLAGASYAQSGTISTMDAQGRITRKHYADVSLALAALHAGHPLKPDRPVVVSPPTRPPDWYSVLAPRPHSAVLHTPPQAPKPWGLVCLACVGGAMLVYAGVRMYLERSGPR